MITSYNETRLQIRLAALVGLLLAVGFAPADAQWTNRTVTEVNGNLDNLQPPSGYEYGEGTPRLDWGDPVAGSFTSYLEFEGYDALPGFDQPWYYGGQLVLPGQRFLAGKITFRNGSVATYSSATNITIDLDVTVYGSEFDRDNHPLLVNDTWTIAVTQTTNQGIDPVEDADFIYFPDFPQLGSFRVFEGRTTSVEIYAQFGSVEPAGFGAVSDPTAGVVLPVPGAVSVDIRPGGCPNPLNVASRGAIPLAILGTADFDVTAIDPDSVRLEGIAFRNRNTPQIADVSRPFEGTIVDCFDCTDAGPDGFPDLVLHFDTQAIVAAIEDELTDGDCLVLSLKGELWDGTEIMGWDVVTILNKKPARGARIGR